MSHSVHRSTRKVVMIWSVKPVGLNIGMSQVWRLRNKRIDSGNGQNQPVPCHDPGRLGLFKVDRPCMCAGHWAEAKHEGKVRRLTQSHTQSACWPTSRREEAASRTLTWGKHCTVPRTRSLALLLRDLRDLTRQRPACPAHTPALFIAPASPCQPSMICLGAAPGAQNQLPSSWSSAQES